MNISNLVEGIQILRKYYSDPDGYPHYAENHVFYMRKTNVPVLLEDLQTLEKLGWFQENVKYLGEKWTANDYNLYESWTAYI